MQEIETNEQALHWCREHGASVNFSEVIRVYLNGQCIGASDSFIEAVRSASTGKLVFTKIEREGDETVYHWIEM